MSIPKKHGERIDPHRSNPDAPVPQNPGHADRADWPSDTIKLQWQREQTARMPSREWRY